MKPSYWAKLWQHYDTLDLMCFPLDIPGLSGVNKSATALPALPSATGNGSNAANFSLLTDSAYTAPTILPSGVRSAMPLSGNASGVVVMPTGFLTSRVSGVAQSSGVLSTNAPQATGGPYSTGNASSILSSGRLVSSSGFKTMPSGGTSSGIYPPMPTGSPPAPPTGSAASNSDFPPMPTGSPPPPPTGGTVASPSSTHTHTKSKDRTASTHSTKSKDRTESTHSTKSHKSSKIKAPYPTTTTNIETNRGPGPGAAHSTESASAGFPRHRY